MQTALHIASADGNLAAVHILLQSGAQIDLMDQDQNTPLILATQNGHNDIVEYLIKAGASITLKVLQYNKSIVINWNKINYCMLVIKCIVK